MARIVASLLQRPHVDKSKRAVRIPIGGHTAETLARSLPEVVVAASEPPAPEAPQVEAEVCVTPEVGTLPCTIEVTDEALAEEMRNLPDLFTEIVVPEVETAEEPVATKKESIVGVEVSEEEVEAALGTEEELAEAQDRVDAHNTEVPEAAEEEEVEEKELKKFDYDAFLSQKPGEIKAALATGDHDHHLTALTEYETAGSARKTVLAHIAGRVKV